MVSALLRKELHAAKLIADSTASHRAGRQCEQEPEEIEEEAGNTPRSNGEDRRSRNPPIGNPGYQDKDCDQHGKFLLIYGSTPASSIYESMSLNT